MRREGCAREEVRLPSDPSTIYRAPRGAPALRDPISKGERRPRGWLAPQGKWGAPTPRVSNPRRRGRSKGGAPAH